MAEGRAGPKSSSDKESSIYQVRSDGLKEHRIFRPSFEKSSAGMTSTSTYLSTSYLKTGSYNI